MGNKKLVLTVLVALTSILGVFSIYFAYSLSDKPDDDVSVAQSCACCVTGNSNTCTNVSGNHVNFGDPLAGSQPECPQAFPIFVGCFNTGPTCGNGQVESGEACEGSGSIACTTAAGYAGTRRCSNCQYGGCTTTQFCGDNICSGPETLANCPADCTNCGDGICSDSETGLTCAADCNTQCNDNLDNDGDGQIDCNDPQCLDANGVCNPLLDLEGEVSNPACGDGIDNDGDGRIDCGGPNGEPADPGCFPDRRGGGGACSTSGTSEIDGAALPQTGVLDENKELYFAIGSFLILIGIFMTRKRIFNLPRIELKLNSTSVETSNPAYIRVNRKNNSTYRERSDFQEKF